MIACVASPSNPTRRPFSAGARSADLPDQGVDPRVQHGLRALPVELRWAIPMRTEHSGGMV